MAPDLKYNHTLQGHKKHYDYADWRNLAIFTSKIYDYGSLGIRLYHFNQCDYRWLAGPLPSPEDKMGLAFIDWPYGSYNPLDDRTYPPKGVFLTIVLIHKDPPKTTKNRFNALSRKIYFPRP